MRALILAAGASLALASCGSGEEAQNAAAASENLSAQSIVVNDATAIDATTAGDADLAADVSFADNRADEAADSNKTANNAATNAD